MLFPVRALKNGNPGRRGVLELGNLGGREGSSGLGNPVRRGGGGSQKCLPSVGGVYFFWNNPIKQNGPKQRETL